MTLEAEITVTHPGFRLDVSLTVAEGETVALVGPNGSGKTTALRAIAGLSPLTAGRVSLGDEVFDDVADGVFVAPEARRVALMFQEHRMFPHLSALDNVAFGLRANGQRRGPARAAARAWLERVGLADKADTPAPALSGGQAQRVALARALATEPRALLLDEPMAALDAASRDAVRGLLADVLHDFRGSTLLVSHDHTDVDGLADLVVVLDHGEVVQRGSIGAIAATPVNDWAARWVAQAASGD